MAGIFAADLLEGQTALVTDASRGIGAAIADALADAGARVIGTATSEAGARAIGERLGAAGEGAVLNDSDPASVEALTGALDAPPDILVNNAGITRDNLLLRMKPDEWDEILQTNLSGVYRMSKACLRGMMKKRAGRIISIASVVGVMGNAGQSNYAAAKAGVIGFSKSLAREVGARGITVNTVAPGFIDTDMTSGLPDAHKTALLEQVPLKRLGEPEEIAAAVSFLASPSAGYV